MIGGVRHRDEWIDMGHGTWNMEMKTSVLEVRDTESKGLRSMQLMGCLIRSPVDYQVVTISPAVFPFSFLVLALYRRL